MDSLKYRYWLRCIPGLGNKKYKKLVEYCGSAKEVYHLTRGQLKEIFGIEEKDIEMIFMSKKNWNLEKEAEKLEKKGISMITMEEDTFPEQLRYLPDCPYALFYKGRMPEENEKMAAIVGARMCSSYGKAVALDLGEKLASCGVSVISGMAMGIDSFGHWGAIKGEGSTYAVLGCGVDVCYPRGGRELYERIVSTGGIISEYLPGTQPFPGQFPARNRIISGLAETLVVVEAKKKSGSLITADLALEQGKDVYAVPGRLDDTLSLGCNELIKQGAGIITSTEEFLVELGFILEKNVNKNEKIKNLLEKEELMVYSCFDLHTKNMEELVQMTGIPPADIANLLVSLQSKGILEEHFKNHYRKI